MKEFGWEVHFATAAQPSEFSLDLKEEGIESVLVELNDSSFDSWIQKLKPDIVLFDRFMTEEQFGWRIEKNAPEALRVLDTSDLHCLREARHRRLKTGKPLDLFNEAALREIASIYRSDLTIMISEYEMSVLREDFGIDSGLLAYCPFFADMTNGKTSRYSERQNFMMIGSFLHEPNWDAVQWCCREIWPLIKQRIDDAELHIYGSYATDKVYQLDNAKRGIRVKGRAADVSEVMKSYRVNLAPLRFGAGLKGKLMDAFVAGLPSVVTPIAAEAMNGELDWGTEIHKDAQGFAKTAVSVYESEALWKNVRDCGFSIAESRFDQSKWVPRLRQAIELSFNRKSDTRRKNFIGQMLRHHQHRSTEFMSRWIEAKNKCQ
ncbi:glycosyltransferase family 4 protein [Puniceicoccaceae bacterium K14]|nr:glycosyltransferase family 4 protein [Puniceicoccaceae bacterium K14]